MGDETNNEAEDEEDGGIPTEAQYTTPQYRSTGRDPMLLHIWTGLMNDSRKIYRPVYRRNRHGTLQRWSYWGRGAWGYSDVPRFDPAHVDGKTDAAEERKEVREPVPSQESVDKGKRRTLADFEFPETEEKGGWRLL